MVNTVGPLWCRQLQGLLEEKGMFLPLELPKGLFFVLPPPLARPQKPTLDFMPWLHRLVAGTRPLCSLPSLPILQKVSLCKWVSYFLETKSFTTTFTFAPVYLGGHTKE